MTKCKCTDCGWTGDDSELVWATYPGLKAEYSKCPDCGSVDIEDLDEQPIEDRSKNR